MPDTITPIDKRLDGLTVPGLRKFAAEQDPPIDLPSRGAPDSGKGELIKLLQRTLEDREAEAVDGEFVETPTAALACVCGAVPGVRHADGCPAHAAGIHTTQQEAVDAVAEQREQEAGPSTELEPWSPVEHSLLPSTETWNQIQRIATDVSRSMTLPAAIRGKIPDIALVLLAGRDVGLAPTVALNKIYIIEGKPSMAPEVMRALILDRGHSIWFEDATKISVTVCARRKEWAPEIPTARVTWDLDMAKDAELIKVYNAQTGAVTSAKDNWRHYPRAMLKARATSEMGRDYFPDVLNGISYTPEELDANTDQMGVPVTVANEGDHGRAPAQATTPPPPDDTAVKDAGAQAAGWDDFPAERAAHGALAARIHGLSPEQRDEAREMREEHGWPMRPKSKFDGMAKWVGACEEANEAEKAASHVTLDDVDDKTARLEQAREALAEAEGVVGLKTRAADTVTAENVESALTGSDPPAPVDDGLVVCEFCGVAGPTKETTLHKSGCPDEAF